MRPGPASAVVCLPDNVTVRLEGATEGIKDSTFAFDKVFGPLSSQADVFAEVSDLVQSALDGYKVGAFHLCCCSTLRPTTVRQTSHSKRLVLTTTDAGLSPLLLVTQRQECALQHRKKEKHVSLGRLTRLIICADHSDNAYFIQISFKSYRCHHSVTWPPKPPAVLLPPSPIPIFVLPCPDYTGFRV